MTLRHTRQAAAVPLTIALALTTAMPSLAADTTLRAQRIVIDSQTGRPRMAEHDELAAASTQAKSAARTRGAPDNAAKSSVLSHPAAQLLRSGPLSPVLGARGHRVDASRLAFTVVHRGADGRMTSQCVTGESALARALKGDLVGDSHEH